MIQLVIGINIAIALFGFYIAWRIWLVKRALTTAAIALTAWERNTHRVLNPERTPDRLLRGQRATASLREKYVRLDYQLQQLRKIFAIALIGLRLLQRRGRPRRKLWRLR